MLQEEHLTVLFEPLSFKSNGERKFNVLNVNRRILKYKPILFKKK